MWKTSVKSFVVKKKKAEKLANCLLVLMMGVLGFCIYTCLLFTLSWFTATTLF